MLDQPDLFKGTPALDAPGAGSHGTSSPATPHAHLYPDAEQLAALMARSADVLPRLRVYFATKVWRRSVPMAWRSAGLKVNASWIDCNSNPLSPTEAVDLWAKCIAEASAANAVFLLACEGDVLRGCLVEAGAALASGKPVYQIGSCESLRSGSQSDASFRYHPLWRFAPTVFDALEDLIDCTRFSDQLDE